MASFAKIGLNSKVIEVLSVHNDVLKDADGVEQEVLGIDFLTKLLGWSIWKQTSYNNSFRKRYAGIGTVYDAAKNKFLNQQPFASWSLDANDDWQAPVTYPAGEQSEYGISWDEAGRQWTGIKESDESKWNWDASGLAWVSA